MQLGIFESKYLNLTSRGCKNKYLRYQKSHQMSWKQQDLCHMSQPCDWLPSRQDSVCTLLPVHGAFQDSLVKKKKKSTLWHVINELQGGKKCRRQRGRMPEVCGTSATTRGPTRIPYYYVVSFWLLANRNFWRSLRWNFPFIKGMVSHLQTVASHTLSWSLAFCCF